VGPTALTQHVGINFDHNGTFGNLLIATFDIGSVYTVDHIGSPKLLPTPLLPDGASGSSITEGPDVAPAKFTAGGANGKLLVTQEDLAGIWAIDNTGSASLFKS
jgi:hypothetical protein